MQRAVYLMVPMFGPWTLEIHPADAADVGASHDEARVQVERSLADVVARPKATGKGSRKLNEHRADYAAWLRRVLAAWCEGSSMMRGRVRVIGVPANTVHGSIPERLREADVK